VSALQTVRTEFRELSAIHAAISLMNWDRQVMMPSGGTEARAMQIGRLTALNHARLTADKLRVAVQDARAEVAGDPVCEREIYLLDRQISQAARLPLDLVTSRAEIAAQAYDVWRRAKPAGDFEALRPYLLSLFNIAKEISSALGYEEHPYDPLLDSYEEGAKTADVEQMFINIQPRVTALRNRILAGGRRIDTSWLISSWSETALRTAAQEIASEIGFDFDRGRLDLCSNAFCTALSLGDVRMATRPSNHIKGVISSSLHELGHALYEQHGNPDWAGTTLAGGASLAVHESQSRMWENIIGRSRSFWLRFFPILVQHAPGLGRHSADEFYRAFTAIQPGWLRVGSDELSYNMHIQVRFEIERDLIAGKFDVKHVPEAWNEKMREYLGVSIESDAQGCLQDVHWFKGSIGYFPTYAMGNLIGGQLWRVIQADLPNVYSEIESGSFSNLLDWVIKNIYSKASSQPPRELVTNLTGSYLDPAPWLEYVESKYSDVYDLTSL
jgi:carboxypeptidase Taq